MHITPYFLFDKTLHPEIGNYPQILFSLLKSTILVNAISYDGYIKGETRFDASFNYLIIENIPSPILKLEKSNSSQFMEGFIFTEKAFHSAKTKNWEAFGINLDKAYGIERQLLESNIKCDLAYSTARSLGAFGGYASENKLFLVCPEDKNAIILKAIEKLK